MLLDEMTTNIINFILHIILNHLIFRKICWYGHFLNKF